MITEADALLRACAEVSSGDQKPELWEKALKWSQGDWHHLGSRYIRLRANDLLGRDLRASLGGQQTSSSRAFQGYVLDEAIRRMNEEGGGGIHMLCVFVAYAVTIAGMLVVVISRLT